MRFITLFILFGVLLISPAMMAAPDTGTGPSANVEEGTPASKVAPTTKVDAVSAADAGTEMPPPIGGTKPPGNVKEGIETARTLWQAIQDKAWWLVAASGVFLAMLVLQLFGAFKKMGKRVTWLVAGGLSFLAAMLLAFDKNGFSWNAFLGFATAGPTIAWLRGFVKKAILNFKKEDPG